MTAPPSTHPGPPFGLGVVGAGAFAGFVLASVADLGSVRTVTVADARSSAAHELARRHGVRAVAADWRVLLADPAVDVLVVATPPATHAEMAVAGLESGRHVFCEKPLATTAADARRVRDAAASAAGVLVVDHVLRYNPLVQLLQLPSLRAVLGRAQRFCFDNDASDESLPPEHWFWDEAVSGGIFIEHGVHFFDACQALLGSQPEAVQAIAARRGGRSAGLLDTVVATTRHPAGALATFAHGFSHPARCERQSLRVDYGFAEARLLGWIPVSGVLEAWTDDTGVDTLQTVCASPERALGVAGFQPSGTERLVLSVERDAGRSTARGRGELRHVPHRARIVADLGGRSAKARVYAQSVRAAMHDLVGCARSGGAPVAGASDGCAAVAVAAAARTSAHEGRTVELDAVEAPGTATRPSTPTERVIR